jgi:signal peptide peptidase SppA
MMSYEILAVAWGKEDNYLHANEGLELKLAEAAVVDAYEREEISRLLTLQDNIAVIEVKGGLTNRNSWYNKYFGLVSYDEIREAIYQAIGSGAGAILFDVNSPGGSVSGLNDIASVVSDVSVPTVTFTSGMMASAGYFFGSQADKVYADSFAEAGSIGVVVKMWDATEYNKKLGVKAIRFRSGDLKAVGSPDFKLTKREEQHIKDQVMTYAGKFYQIVSDARGMPLELMEKLEILTGKTFIGEELKRVNLVDDIRTFDQVLKEVYDLAEKELDKRNRTDVKYFGK